MTRIFRTNITLSTAVIADSAEQAEKQVMATLPDDLTFGEWGRMLPFEAYNIETTEINDEDIGRG